MLSRKKTRTELSKPGEVQGKYVKKETSPLLRSECRGGPAGADPAAFVCGRCGSGGPWSCAALAP